MPTYKELSDAVTQGMISHLKDMPLAMAMHFFIVHVRPSDSGYPAIRQHLIDRYKDENK